MKHFTTSTNALTSSFFVYLSICRSRHDRISQLFRCITTLVLYTLLKLNSMLMFTISKYRKMRTLWRRHHSTGYNIQFYSRISTHRHKNTLHWHHNCFQIMYQTLPLGSCFAMLSITSMVERLPLVGTLWETALCIQWEQKLSVRVFYCGIKVCGESFSFFFFHKNKTILSDIFVCVRLRIKMEIV